MVFFRRRARREVFGYHGTTKEVALLIARDGFRPSTNNYDWLGDGIYFWQDAPARAREWAEQNFAGEGAVVGAHLTLDDEWMDLLDIEWWSALRAAYEQLAARYADAEVDLPQQSGGAHRLDAAVINYSTKLAADEGLRIRAVRAAFLEGEPVFPKSAIFNRAHVQIAVRDARTIDDVFVVP